MRPFAIENSAEMKYWQQLSISKFRELCSIILNIFIGCPAQLGS